VERRTRRAGEVYLGNAFAGGSSTRGEGVMEGEAKGVSSPEGLGARGGGRKYRRGGGRGEKKKFPSLRTVAREVDRSKGEDHREERGSIGSGTMTSREKGESLSPMEHV